jgi:hypothetical protein
MGYTILIPFVEEHFARRILYATVEVYAGGFGDSALKGTERFQPAPIEFELKALFTHRQDLVVRDDSIVGAARNKSC